MFSTFKVDSNVLLSFYSMDYTSRSRLLLKKDGLDKLAYKHVAIFGAGGVGGAVIEALARSGIKELSLIDDDIICVTNLNRQIISLTSNIAELKVEAYKKRILDIDKNIVVHTYPLFFDSSNINDIPFKDFDYIVDAIDTISSKILLVELSNKYNISLISAMGAANKLNPMGFMVSDIFKTEMDPIAKIMRYELRKRNIHSLKVVYSKEKPLECEYFIDEDCIYKNKCKDRCHINKKKNIPGTVAMVPNAMGLLIASEVIKDLLEE